MTAILFLLAALVMIGFVVFTIIDPSSEAKKTRQELLQTLDPEKEYNFGSLLLKAGPVFFGFGGIGYLINKFWDKSDIRLWLVTGFTVLILGAAYGLYFWAKSEGKSANRNVTLALESLMILGTFSIGTLLFSINGYTNDKFGYLTFGAAEIFGLWTLFITPMVYLTRSKWLLGVQVTLSVFWFSIYLSDSFNLIKLFSFDLLSYKNQTALLLLPVAASVVFGSLYAWHQKNHHNLPESGWRPFFYITGLLTYLSAGSLIMHTILMDGKAFYSGIGNGVVGDIVLALVAIGIFVIDYLAKKSLTGYNINYLVPIVVVLTAAFGLITQSSTPFIGFWFLEVPFIVWLLADYLRQNSQLAQILFYGFNAVQLFLISTDGDNLNWLKLIVLLAILLYSAMLHYTNRALVFYVMIAGIMSVIFKLLAFQANRGIDGFLIIMAIGALVSVYGLFFAQTRSQMIKDKKSKM
jgi:hypothetical protein